MSEGEITEEKKEEEKKNAQDPKPEGDFDDLFAALDEELAPEASSGSLTSSLSSSFVFEKPEKTEEKEEGAPETPVSNVFQSLICETASYTVAPPKKISSSSAPCLLGSNNHDNKEEGEQESGDSSSIPESSSPNLGEAHNWEARRQPLKPIVLSGHVGAASPSPSPPPGQKKDRRHRISVFFRHNRSSSDSEGKSSDFASAHNTVNLSNTVHVAQSPPSIQLGTARQRAISDTPTGHHRPPLSSVVVPPIQTELEPWMKEFGVDEEVASVLKEHNYTLAQIRTMTDAELRGLGVQSLAKRLEFYYCCYAGRRSVQRAPRDIRSFAHKEGEGEKVPQQPAEEEEKKSFSEEEKAVICCQDLIRSSLATRFFSDSASSRYSTVQKLISTLKEAEQCFGKLYSFLTGLHASVAAVEGESSSSSHGVDDGFNKFEPFVILLQVWNDIQKVLSRMLRRWSRLSCPGVVLLSDVSLEWWYSAFLFFFSRRGQFALRMDSLSKNTNKKISAVFERSVASVVSAGYDPPNVLLYSASKKYLGAMLACLEELEKETSLLHEDYQQLSLVVSRVKALQEADTRTANNDTAAMAKYQTLAQLAKSITDAPREIVAWSRGLISTGKVIVLRPEIPDSKRHHRSNYEMLLFNDIIVLGKKGKTSSNMRFKGMYYLKDIEKVVDIPDGSCLGPKLVASRVWSLMMAHPVYFQAVSDKEKSEYIKRVQTACDNAKEHIKRTDSEQVAIRNGLATETK